MSLLSTELLNRLSALTLRSKRRGAGLSAGGHRSTRRGQSQEFADHRPYVPGDDLRFLDWHLLGRLDSLWIKLFEEEADRVVQCMIDASASMQGDKLQFSRQVAAALSWVALGHGDRVAIAALSDELKSYQPPRRGRGQRKALFDALEAIQPGGSTQLGAAIHRFPRQRGSGLALLFTDFLYEEPVEKVMRRLLARGNELHVFHVLSPADIRPDLDGDVVLVDAETGEEMTVTVDEEVLDRYEATVAAWAEDVSTTARRLGVGYSRLLTSTNPEDVVLGELRKQGLVG